VKHGLMRKRPLRTTIRNSMLRERLRAVRAGSGGTLNLDLDDQDLQPDQLLLEAARNHPPGSPELDRLVGALAASGVLARIVDGLADENIPRRWRCIRAAGAIRLEAAVPWLAILLAGSDKPTRWAAARALGRISGSRAADALLLALRGRRLAGGRLVIELCRAAPDLYLESIIDDPKNSAVRAHLAAALAFRRRRTGLLPLRRLAGIGTERERLVACRALGRLGDCAATDWIIASLGHRSWRVRVAACRALGQLGGRGAIAALRQRAEETHPSARAAAEHALRRLEALQA